MALPGLAILARNGRAARAFMLLPHLHQPVELASPWAEAAYSRGVR